MYLIFRAFWLKSDCISNNNLMLFRQKDLLKICRSLFSSLLCNLCILLYFFSHPALPYAHFLPLSCHILPSSTTLPFGSFPLLLSHLLSLYNLCITAVGDNSSTHSLPSSLPFSNLLANPVLLQSSSGEASHGNIQHTYPERSAPAVCLCVRARTHMHTRPASASPTQCWYYFSNRDARLS